jgi:hypothetical protein
MTKSFAVFLMLSLASSLSNASVIVSKCKTSDKEWSQGSSPPEKTTPPEPPDFTPSAEYLKSGAWHWLAVQVNKFRTGDEKLSPEQSAKIARIADDLRLYSFTEQEDPSTCESDSAAIFPYVASIGPKAEREDVHVGFKICQFYQEADRQTTIENTCRIIGNRPEGYSLVAFDERYLEYSQTVTIAKNVFNTGVTAVGLFGSSRIFKFLRNSAHFATVGGVTKLALTSLPTVASTAYIEWGGRFYPFTNMLELRDSAKLIFDGKVVDVAYVSMPIQDYEHVLSGWLATIPNESPSPPAPPNQKVSQK